MGTRNKQRRRDKARRRAEKARRRASRTSGSSGFGQHHGDHGDRVRIREALWNATGLQRRPASASSWSELTDAGVELVAAEAEELLGLIVARVWHDGWQPAELARHARRTDSRLGRIVVRAIAADHARRDPATLHPRWAAQVDALDVAVPSPGCLLEAVADDDAPIRQVRRIVGAVRLFATLGTLPTILPPPGSDPTTWERDRPDATDDPLLAKVRALLAQAESTNYDAEAEAFTAKAQELMARHALDSAMVWSRSEHKVRPIAVRLPIDDPYADQKSLLLHVVAEHSQCTAVLHTAYALQSVVGFASDVAAAEMLYTSLLVQSQAAMQAEAANAPPGSHVRSRRFRSAFLEAYACRIGQRLAEVNRQVRADAEAEEQAAAARDRSAESALLPALVARREAIDAELDELFGELTTKASRRRYDAMGWDRGRLAADRAEINQAVDAPG